MPSRDDFQFVLLPWEHRGADFDPRPDVIVQLEWEAVPRLFLLKAKKNTLFFREAHQTNDFLCALETPLFSRSLPEEETRDWMQANTALIANFWQEEMQARRYARCILGEHPYLKGIFQMFFKQDGHGWLREPWDEDGLTFTWESNMVWPDPLFQWIPESFPTSSTVFSNNGHLTNQIEEREMPTNSIEEHPLEWICGSQQELEQLTNWMAFTEPGKWSNATQITFIFSCENDEGRAELRGTFENGVWSEPSVRLKGLTDLALDFNTPIGIQWEFCDGSYGDPPIRGSWTPEGPELSFVVDQPSHHEQIEARIQLRNWLHNKAPQASIESWLQ